VIELQHLDAYKLKWIAIIGMFFNHMVIAWWAIIPHWLTFPLYAVGGLTFPIMAYFVVEGYRYTSSLNKYIWRLFIFGLIAMPFHILALGVPLGPGYPILNIMFSIILGLLVLVLYDKIKTRALFWLMYIVLIVPISLIFFEWYFIGVTMVLLFHIIRNENTRRIVPPVFAGVSWLAFSLLAIVTLPLVEGMESVGGLVTDPYFLMVMPSFTIGCFLAAFLLKNFNGERGKRMKWLFYIFYPLHLAILAIVALALGLVDLSVFGF